MTLLHLLQDGRILEQGASKGVIAQSWEEGELTDEEAWVEEQFRKAIGVDAGREVGAVTGPGAVDVDEGGTIELVVRSEEVEGFFEQGLVMAEVG